MKNAVPISPGRQGGDKSPSLSPQLQSNLKKSTLWNGDPPSSAISETTAALKCSLVAEENLSAEVVSHPLQQLRLRPASWSQESFDDSSDDEWPSRDQPIQHETNQRTSLSPALSAHALKAPPERPVGSITGIFSREAHFWAASTMYPQPMHPYAVNPLSPKATKGANLEPPMDEPTSENEVPGGNSRLGSSSSYSVPQSEDEESRDEPMDVDADPAPAPPASPLKTVSDTVLLTAETDVSLPAAPQLRRSARRKAPVIVLPKVSRPRRTVVSNRMRKEGDAEEEKDTPEPTTEASSSPGPVSTTRSTRSAPPPPTTEAERSSSESVEEQILVLEPAPPAPPEPSPTTPRHKEIRLTSPQAVRPTSPQAIRPKPLPQEEKQLITSTRAEYEMPAVMMFSRRSSPGRAVPLERFARGKGKIPCSWTPPPGHRPCMRSFTRRADLERHIATVHQMLNVACGQCGATFSRQDALTRHQRDSCAALFTTTH